MTVVRLKKCPFVLLIEFFFLNHEQMLDLVKYFSASKVTPCSIGVCAAIDASPQILNWPCILLSYHLTHLQYCWILSASIALTIFAHFGTGD